MPYLVQTSKPVVYVSHRWPCKVVAPRQQLMAQICGKSLPCQGIPVTVLLWLVWEMSELHLLFLEEETHPAD